MNQEYLQELLKQVKDLKVGQVNEAKAIVIKAGEALKQAFPGEFSQPGEISRLKFIPTWFPSSEKSEKEQFIKSKNILVSTLEVKIDVLKNVAKKENLLATPSKALAFKILNEAAVTESYENKISKLRSSLSDAKSIIMEAELQIIKLIQELTRAKKIRIFQDLGVGGMICGAFALGIYLGNAKFDSDKNNMVDEIRIRKSTIDSLNKVIVIQRDRRN